MKRIAVYILVFIVIGSTSLIYSFVNDSISPIYAKQTGLVKQQSIECIDPVEPIYIGPILGISQNFMSNVIHSASKFTPPGIDIKPSCYGYNYGLSSEIRLGEIFCYSSPCTETPDTSFQSIIINLRYNTMKFSSETSIINPAHNNQMLDLTGREKDSSKIPIIYKNEFELTTICTDVLFKLNIFKKLGILTGASFDFVMTHNLKESLSLINSDQILKFKKQDGIILDESGKSGTIFKADSAYFSSFQLALTCGIQYEFDVTKSIFISPYFIYGYNVITLQENSNIRLSNLNFGVAVHFKL